MKIIAVITSTIHKGVRQDILVITGEVATSVNSLVTIGLETCSALAIVAIGMTRVCLGSGSLVPIRLEASVPLGSQVVERTGTYSDSRFLAMPVRSPLRFPNCVSTCIMLAHAKINWGLIHCCFPKHNATHKRSRILNLKKKKKGKAKEVRQLNKKNQRKKKRRPRKIIPIRYQKKDLLPF